MPQTLAFIVTKDTAGTRIDRFLSTIHPDISRNQYLQHLKEQRVTVSGNQVKPGYKLKDGEKVTLLIPDPEPLVLTPESIDLDIIFEDNSVIVINKPAGMVVHPGCGVRSGTLVNALLKHCTDLSGIGGVERPGIVHRLDKETSGLIVVAKNDLSHRNLSLQLEKRLMSKKYIAITKNEIRYLSGEISSPIGRHPVNRKKMSTSSKRGKDAITCYKIIEKLRGHTLVELKLITGRTHQIRVHLASIGCPVLGDKVYGNGGEIELIHRQALHAASLSFVHPYTKERLDFNAPLPHDFEEALRLLRQYV